MMTNLIFKGLIALYLKNKIKKKNKKSVNEM